MPRVIGYTFEADVHCVQCTLERHRTHPFALEYPEGMDKRPDENGLPYAAVDTEGNSVHPTFSTDENATEEHCGDCGEALWQ
jgi:hypothetical protein